ncbi:NUDIX domain-containing protein [Sulfitobacter aestuariivivens]|uniref:NUDIX hydrolase n=1 Tax=Sulfitobacter aestuariivivens TaxID=2766981 RepID=A0A927D9L3_9RHOB|nr:NUDIX hydrolase [Sulfitobacter aestuariivivens]MBD3665251.1 NUDIX hydrolase [Sulfitobacter aestuariivivens]
MIRRIGQVPRKDQTYQLRAGAYAILPLQRRFLLVAQITDEVEVMLPGGGIDPGESPIRALHREVLEETGWRIARPRRLGAFRRFVYMPDYDLWAEKLCHVYVADPIRQITAPIEPDHHAVVMSAAEGVHSLGNDGDSLFLARYAGLAGPV